MAQLTIVKPQAIATANLVATDVPETDYAEYAAGTTYAAGALVIVAADHMIYSSLQAGNVGHAPSVSPLWWAPVRATNRWRMFDYKSNTKTAKATSFYFEFTTPDLIDSLAVLGLEGHSSVRVRQTHATLGQVYDVTTDFAALPVSSDWYAWTFEPRGRKATQLVLSDLKPYPDCTVRVDFAGGSTLAAGTLLVGFSNTIGMGVQVGASAKIEDYSRRVQNEWGDYDLQQGEFSKLTRLPMTLPVADFDAVFDYLSDLRSTPALYIGGEAEALTVYGFYEDFDTVFTYSTYLDLNINVQGLT